MRDINFILKIVSGFLLASLVTSASHGILDLCWQNHLSTGIHPHPYDCSMFIECSGGVTSEMDCPANLVFDPNILACEDPQLAPPCNGPTSTSTTQSSTLPSSSSTTSATTTTTTPPTTTTTSTTTTTPATTTTTSTTSTTSSTTMTSSIAPASTMTSTDQSTITIDYKNYCTDHSLSNGIHPDPGSCDYYIECNFGQTYRMPCPPGLGFNVNLNVCDDIRHFNCHINQGIVIG